MLKNYLKITLRNIKQQKSFSIINISGLAIGMACFILIMQWVQDELSYDRYHKNAARICRVIWDIDGFQIPATPGPFADWLKEYVPEIEKVTRINHGGGVLQYGEKKIEVTERYIEPRFFDIFSFRLVRGDSGTALNQVESIILTQESAHKLFGDENPIGKTIVWQNGNRPKKVTGIIENIPRLTSPYLKADCFVPLDLMRRWRNPDTWEDGQDYKTYVSLHKNASPVATTAKINSEFKKFLEKYDPESAKKNMKFFLQPITTVHLYSDFKFDFPQGNIQYVVFFGLIAIFILMIACFNFMNLATARSLKRAKEVGLRKVIGANRWQLVRQFLGESLIITTIAFVLSMIIVELVMPAFNILTGKPLVIDYSNTFLLGGLLGILIFTGIVSGSYPAIFLSSFQPTNALKDQNFLGAVNRSSFLRKVLVVTQFALSIMIIVGTVVVYLQLDFIKNKHLGFEKENLIYLETRSHITDYETLKNDLLQYPEIAGTSASQELPTQIGQNVGANWEGKEKNAEYISFPSLFVSADFLETFGAEMAEGRFFSKEHATDQRQAFVLNEAAIKAMKLQEPVGKKFSAWDKDGSIIGVVKDFHFKSLRSAISPIMLNLGDEFRFLFVKVKSGNIRQVIDRVKQVYRQHYPDHLIEVHFFDEAIDELYKSEKKMEALFFYFSILAIVISCMGLLGLASFIAENKIKEIGVRKILGASVAEIMNGLAKPMVKWVLYANVLAWPIAWYAMHKWLQNFAYRINMSWWMFVLAGGIALVIALLTVSWQAIRAATANPVEALRYE